MADIPRDFPHVCGQTRTWTRTSDTKYEITCSFCKKKIGYWQFYKTHTEKKIYPEHAKFDLAQKRNWK